MGGAAPETPPEKPAQPGTPGAGKAEQRVHVAVGVILSIAIVGMLNYLAFRHYERFDWTEDRLFTVSERTVEVLRGLDRPIDVYLFLSPGEENYEDMGELLQAYGSHTRRVRVHRVDPHRQAAEFRVLAERFGIATLTSPDGAQTASDVAVVVVAGDRNWKITRDDLFSYAVTESGAPQIDVEAERALTGAIVEATTGRPTKVCATTGHGEWDLATSGERGLAGVRETLDRDNVEMRAIETLGGRAIPEDCDAVFVVGPDRAFAAEEVRAIDAYLGRGGNAFLAFDPIIDGERVRATGFESMLRRHGVELDPTLVLELDPRHLPPQGSPETFAVTDYGDHDVTARIAAVRVPSITSLARSVRPAESSEAATIVRTTERGFAARNLGQLVSSGELTPGPDDVRGPVSFGVATAVERVGADAERPAGGEGRDEDRGGRLVVMGDADFLTSDLLADPSYANVDILSGITGWVTYRRALMSISPRTSDVAAVVMTEGDLQNVMIRVLVLLPLAVILLGISVWWGRRS